MTKISAIAVIILVLILSGCAEGGVNDRYSSETQEDKEYDYHDMYVNKDTGDLTDKELEAFQEASRVYELYIENCESDFDKVKAAHDYIIKNCTYNKKSLDDDTLTDDDFSVYGVLVKELAVCEGYAETFQMFMDIAQIDCIIVTGTVGEEQISHAWNMVKLDDSWYHVDVTFDDPYPETEEIIYLYLNVSDEVIEKDHSWNKNVTPQAASTEYDYIKMMGNYISTLDELREIVVASGEQEKSYMSFVWSGVDIITDEQWQSVLKNTEISNISYSCLGVEGRRIYMVDLAY